MIRCSIILLVSLTALIHAQTVKATPITFTGAELFADPDYSPRSGIVSVVGDSLRIRTSGTFNFVSFLSLDRFNVDPTNFNFTLNLTRLASSTSNRADYDPFIYLSDGFNLFGVQTSEVGEQILVTTARLDRVSSSGNGISSFGAPGFIGRHETGASIGDTYNLNIAITRELTDGRFFTRIRGLFNNQLAANGTTSMLVGQNGNDFGFVFGSIANNANYQLNSLTFNSGLVDPNPPAPEPDPTAIAEPANAGVFMLGLLGLGLRRRKRINKAYP